MEYCCWPHPNLYDHSLSIFRWLLLAGKQLISQRSKHLKLLCVCLIFLNITQMGSTVTEPQSKRAALCGETGDSHHTKEEMLLLHLLKVFIGTDVERIIESCMGWFITPRNICMVLNLIDFNLLQFYTFQNYTNVLQWTLTNRPRRMIAAEASGRHT